MINTTYDQMFIITSSCYKCKEAINVAIIKSEGNNRNHICGPEVFTEEEKRIAKDNSVLIKEHYSFTMKESYHANTCPHCEAFIGQHFLFTNYYISAVQYRDVEYIVIDLK